MNADNKFLNWIKRNIKLVIILTITLVIHLSLLLFYKFDLAEKEIKKDNKIFYMSDITVREYVPQDALLLERQDKTAEQIIETEQEVKELNSEGSSEDQEYKSPVNGADLPIFPDKKIRSRLYYPEDASEQGIEDTVVLELYIDKDGNIKKIIVIKDPGHGFAQSAVKAFEKIKCTPAKINGVPFSVKIRKTIRFVLN
jgi:protein TonB